MERSASRQQITRLRDSSPVGNIKFADFMGRIGSLKHKPNSWKDYFFEEIHNLPGS